MSANLGEVFKGIAVFLFGSFLFYFGWNTFFGGTLTYLTSVSSYLGALGWFSFLLVYIFSCPAYMIYCIVVGSRGQKTDVTQIGLGIVIWFVGMIAITGCYYVFFYPNVGLVELLGGTTISGTINSIDTGQSQNWNNNDVTSVVTQIGSLGTIVVMLIFALAPMYFFMKGYGINLGGQSQNAT